MQRWRERTVTTVGGTLTPERPWDHHRRWLHGWSPTDRTWRLAARARISAGLAGWRIDRGASAGVADARRELGRLTGLAVAAETIRVTTAATMVVAEGISVA